MKKTLKIIGCVILVTIFCFNSFKVLAQEENTPNNGELKSSEVSNREVQKEEKMTNISEDSSELSEDEKKENLEENKEIRNSLVLRSSVSNQYEVDSENNEKVEEQVVLEDGEYRIKSQKNHDRYIGIENGSKQNEAKVVLQNYRDELNIVFEVKYEEDGFYTIKAMNSSKVIDVPGASKSLGTKLNQYESNGTDAQKWIIKENDNGTYSVVSKCNNFYWDLPGAATDIGTNLQMYEGNGTLAQQFIFEKIEHVKGKKDLEDGEYRIKSEKNHDRYVGIENGSKQNEAKVVLQNYRDELNIVFEVKYEEDGFYTIKAMNSSKVIDVPGASKSLGTKLNQYESNGTDAQKWIIKENDNGTYSVVSKCNNFYWDLPGAATDIGTNLQMYEGNGTLAQQFIFEKIEHVKGKKDLEDGEYRIKSEKNHDRYVGIENGSKQNEAKVVLQNYRDELNIVFEVKYEEDGFYTIKAMNSSKVIDVPGASKSLGTKLNQYESNGTDAQKWIIKENDNGTYSVVSKCNNFYWDLPGAATDIGTNLQMYEGNGTLAQQFIFEKIEHVKGKKDLEDGEYRIKSEKNHDRYVGIENGSKQNEAKVVLQNYRDELNIVFEVKYEEDGFYTIKAMNSSKVIDVPGASKSLGTKLNQYESNGTDAQKWIIKENDNGTYSVVSKCNNFYWDLPGAATDIGTNLQMYEGNGTLAQQFIFEKIEHVKGKKDLEDGEYRIKSEKNHDRYVGIENGSKQNEAKVVLQNYRDELNIVFEVKYEEDGFYTIKAMNSSKVIDVPGASKSLGTKLNQYESNGTDAQKWIIKENDNGTYSVVSKCNNFYWDLPGAATDIGTKVQMYEGNGTLAQQFVFEKIEHVKGEKTLEDGEYKIKLSEEADRYIGIEDDSMSDEAKVVVKDLCGDIFDVRYLGDGCYKIESKKSKKVIDVPGASRAKTTLIQQYSYNGTDAQKWIIKDLGNEKFCIISKCNDLCWDLPGASTDIGTRIQMYSMNSTIAQKFKFEKVEQQESTALIESGIYKIKSAKDTSKVFGIVNASKENCAKLILTDDVDGNYQKFYISDVGNGCYEIKLVHSNKTLDVPGASIDTEVKIQQYDSNGTDAQKWIIKANENGTCSIVSKCNYLYLDLPGGSVNVGNEVQTYSGNGTLAQQFIIEKTEPRAIEEGVYEIETSLGNDMVLDISGGSTSNNANVQLWKKDNVLQQKFKISYVKGGYYKIEAIHSKKALDIDSSGTNVVQYDSGDRDSQQWRIVDSRNGTYSIISKSTGKYLNIQDDVADYRANVNVSSKNNKSSQKFKLKSTNVGELRGIDVSSHQGNINWEAVKNSGIDFVILRCGYGENLASQDDTRFVTNMLECERLGIDYGVYLYSYALNENGAVSEANHVLRLIKGHNVKYGVWFDMEDADGYKERKGMPSDATLVNICKVFCDTIRANGYDAGIYASYYWLVTSLNSSKLDEYDKWVAQWSSRCSYTKPYKMWQYSSSGTVNGISGSVDMNIMYR